MSGSIARFGIGFVLAPLAAGCFASTDAEPNAVEEPLGVHEAALTAVASFGNNPGALKMFTYSPPGVGENAPLVVALHGCTQTAADYVKAGWNDLANTLKFHVIYPEQQTANSAMRCFNWYELGDIKRGAGEALSIKQMVDAMKAQYAIDSDRVFVTGLSAGGAMTAVMLAAYPDVFAGGAILAGIPYSCATNSLDMSKCMSPGVDKTPSAWGDLVRAAMPAGYAGRLPKVSVWHGTGDAVVKPVNTKELVDQWTNVHGIDATADATSTVSGATRTEYRSAGGATLVETYSIPNMGHGTPVDPGFAPAGGCGAAGSYILDVNLCSTYQIGLFFGLDQGSGGDGGAGGAGSSSSSSASSSSSSSSASSSSSSGAGGAGSSSSSSASSSSSSGAGGAGGAGGGTCEETYDANYYHVTEGRAVRCGVGGSYVCALGSNQNLGLYNMMSTWIRETAPGYYEAGRCP
jgi:poly(hydroxyalkanoate) depolymerase family esterase